MFPIGFLPIVPALFSQEGTACSWDELSTLGGRAVDNAIIFCAKCGAVYWERADALCRSCSGHPGGLTSQLRKLRSGLCPNKRYPRWTVEDVRRPSTDEAAALVVQLESCEAGLGRTVTGPTTPKKQRVSSAGTLGMQLRGGGLGHEALGPGSNLPSRLRVLMLARQTEGSAHTRFPNSLWSSAQAGPWRFVYVGLRWINRL